MYDQSLNKTSLAKALRRSDFHRILNLRNDALCNKIIEKAVACGEQGGWIDSPLKISKLKGKNVYSLPNFHDELVIRKINNNIKHFKKLRTPARSSIIINLSRIVAEAVSYRIYRLDVKSFFESFSISHVLKKIDDIEILSLTTKRLLRDLFRHFVESGGTGIPRGLAISSTLSELMMAEFDSAIKMQKNVFFYARYVDDIIIVTSGTEPDARFLKTVRKLLPDGLKLSNKKQDIRLVPKVTKTSNLNFNFEYLGYKFTIKDPGSANSFRLVSLGIAESKLKKIKTRLVFALKDFCITKDVELLQDRL